MFKAETYPFVFNKNLCAALADYYDHRKVLLCLAGQRFPFAFLISALKTASATQ